MQQLPFVENIFEMLSYVLLACLEKLRHHLLRQPAGLILETDIDLDSTAFLVNKKLTYCRQVIGHFHPQYPQISQIHAD